MSMVESSPCETAVSMGAVAAVGCGTAVSVGGGVSVGTGSEVGWVVGGIGVTAVSTAAHPANIPIMLITMKIRRRPSIITHPLIFQDILFFGGPSLRGQFRFLG